MLTPVPGGRDLVVQVEDRRWPGGAVARVEDRRWPGGVMVRAWVVVLLSVGDMIKFSTAVRWCAYNLSTMRQ